jgi:glycosyltransferase involved in cell wall biosynthesis
MTEKQNTTCRSLHIAVIGIKGIPARYGGFETCADETCRRLVKRGHKVTVYCRQERNEKGPSEFEQVTLCYVPFVNSKNFATISSSFLACLQAVQSKAEVVHLYTVGTGLFIPLLRVFGKRVVISVDALDWKRKKWSKVARGYMQLAAWISVQWADELIIDSRSIQTYYLNRFKRPGVYVPFGANIEPYKGSTALANLRLQPKKYVLFVGILRPEKQVGQLIQAFNGIQQDKYDLVILGDDPLGKEYCNWLKSLAGPRVRFLGRIYGEAYTQICQNAYIYVTPSEVEGTSPALLSAMGAGCCVLVNGIPENLEVIGEAGFSYRRNDVQDLREKLFYLFCRPDLVTAYGEKARERTCLEYRWDMVTSALEAIYYKARDRSRASSPS